MKAYTFLVIALLMVALVPMVLAEEAGTGGGVSVGVGNPNDAPVVCTDHTARSWYPNDQTIYTARAYGNFFVNRYGDQVCEVSERGNYVFAGETLTYYVLVQDLDGADDIQDVILQKDGVGIGACAPIDYSINRDKFNCNKLDWNEDEDTMQLYKCKMVVRSGSGWNNAVSDINVKATDRGTPALSGTSAWTDRLVMNPALQVSLNGGISFGTVEPGETAMSNSVYLKNVGSNGVVMDMYIASDDYFTDPNRPDAICGDANGIPYYKFSYYATKGSLNSGANNNQDNGLGVPTGEIKSGIEIMGGAEGDNPYQCVSNPDEYTTLPSHSGEIWDMCRIINHRHDGSLLVQGQSMSLTFQLDVPEPCEGSFSEREFHFVGRVV